MSNEDDRVEVTITAGPNRGKTTIASIIRDALVSAGFKDVEIYDPIESKEPKEPVTKRFEATKRRPVRILVNTTGDMTKTVELKQGRG
jgi:hypothetical protein